MRTAERRITRKGVRSLQDGSVETIKVEHLTYELYNPRKHGAILS